MPRNSAKLFILSLLYFVQGLPFGFQATALPVFLRSEHVALGAIGLVNALALPWMLKAAWAPIVDRYTSRRWGRRRTWILPMQALLAGTCFVAGSFTLDNNLVTLLALVFFMNLFAATMDIAVDGLAVDTLGENELGYGNIAQVVGYKLGMLTGGGLLLWLSRDIGWSGMFMAMGALVAAVFVATCFFREPRGSLDRVEAADAPSFASIFATLAAWLKHRHTWWLLSFVGTYKIGESMADAMFKPFLVDAGFSPSDIGLWVGAWGMTFSLVGSFLGGVLASRIGLMNAVAITAVLRVLPVAGEWWLSLGHPTAGGVISVTCAEHFFGGALTTAVFAFMMSRVDRRIGATHYTLIATVEVLGKSPSAWLSGFVAATLGYPALFAIATFLSFAFLALIPRRDTIRPASPQYY